MEIILYSCNFDSSTHKYSNLFNQLNYLHVVYKFHIGYDTYIEFHRYPSCIFCSFFKYLLITNMISRGSIIIDIGFII